MADEPWRRLRTAPWPRAYAPALGITDSAPVPVQV